MNVGQELLNVPMGEMIKSMALAIADGQWALDKASIVVSEMMSGQRLLRDLDTGRLENPIKDKNGKDAPRIVDSRVYFGYNYADTGETKTTADKKTIKIYNRVPQKVSMMELGFTPNFYQFVDTIIEVKIAIKVTSESTSKSVASSSSTTAATQQSVASSNYSSNYRSGSWWYNTRYNSNYNNSRASANKATTVNTAQVDASYANKYSYSIDGASLLRTKLTPVPPPAILEERLREVMQAERDFREDMKANKVAYYE